jgi:hypothetical protein
MPAAPPVLWQIQRRPRGRILAFAILLGLVLAGGSTLLISSLMVERDPILAGAIGAGLGLFLVLSLGHGASVRVERGARLVYSLRGHDSVVVDTTQITNVRHLSTGALSGIGIECPLDALTFVSRKGVTRRHCEDLQRHLGVALVLEFLRPEDVEPLVRAIGHAR